MTRPVDPRPVSTERPYPPVPTIPSAEALSVALHRIDVLESIICTLRRNDSEGLWHGELTEEEEAVMKEVY